MAKPITPTLTAAQEAVLTQNLNGAAFDQQEVLGLLRAIAFVTSGAGSTAATTTARGTVLRTATVSAVSTADATDLATALVLVNDLKAKFNALRTALLNAGIVS
jgi:hypothetical protein